MSIFLSELRSPEVKQAGEAGAVVVLPVGQIEEHGPHLPIHTDLFIARRAAEESVRKLQGAPLAYVLEPIAYGFSQKVLKKWAGTFTLPYETVIDTAKHIMICLADMGFRKIVLLSTHGNHPGILRVAMRAVADERGIGPALFNPAGACGDVMREHGRAGPLGSCHAGEYETSLMLHLAPEQVDMSLAVGDDKLAGRPPYPSSQAFVSTWSLQESQSGAYGDPTVATPELGKKLFDRMTDATAEFIRTYHALKQI